MNSGTRFREALQQDHPLLLPGAYSPTSAMIVQRAGFRAAYLSGSGVAAALGLPDLGMTTLTEVAAETRRLTAATPELPFIVDADTGFGSSELNIQRTVQELIHAGAAGLHLEDQDGAKRCGHRPNKRIIATEEMVARLTAANAARMEHSPAFFIIARTDAFGHEGIDATIERCNAYVAAGADALFPEALTSLEEYEAVCKGVNRPVLANITEFGKTPMFTADELFKVGVRIVLFPLTLFRVSLGSVARAARDLRREGTQKGLVDDMYTREQFYDLIHYHDYEDRLDSSR
jgi:methylisocitrate lyase